MTETETKETQGTEVMEEMVSEVDLAETDMVLGVTTKVQGTVDLHNKPDNSKRKRRKHSVSQRLT